MSVNYEIEPGASSESPLVTSNSYDNMEQMSSSLEEIKNSSSFVDADESAVDNCNNVEVFEDACANLTTFQGANDEDYTKNNEWLSKRKHVFILSSAGKPIYSRYGNEDKLASLYGVMQALVSFVQHQDDCLQSIRAGDTNIVFLCKNHLILVAISRTNESTSQLMNQLTNVFNQITSILTLTRLNKIFEQRRNYDLRRLLSGAERLIDHLLDLSEREPAFLLGAVQCLTLPSSVRESISSAIVQSCNKIKNLVFAVLLANNRLITLVRMKKYCMHPADLHLICNLVQASESLKTAESWTPLCLPRFDPSGFLYAHVSYLSEDCQACLLLLTVERDVFFSLSEAKQRIVEKLRRANCLEAINESLATKDVSCLSSDFPELRHYLYKCKSTSQFYQSSISPPYTVDPARLMIVYNNAHQLLHCPARPLKLVFSRSPGEAVLAWDTKGFELYAIFEPLTDTCDIVNTVSKLLNWIKKQEGRLFHLNAPTF